jgi:hypothetical protein
MSSRADYLASSRGVPSPLADLFNRRSLERLIVMVQGYNAKAAAIEAESKSLPSPAAVQGIAPGRQENDC